MNFDFISAFLTFCFFGLVVALLAQVPPIIWTIAIVITAIIGTLKKA